MQNPGTLPDKKPDHLSDRAYAPFALVQRLTFAVTSCRYTALNPCKIKRHASYARGILNEGTMRDLFERCIWEGLNEVSAALWLLDGESLVHQEGYSLFVSPTAEHHRQGCRTHSARILSSAKRPVQVPSSLFLNPFQKSKYQTCPVVCPSLPSF
jgi:hypothetical protein